MIRDEDYIPIVALVGGSRFIPSPFYASKPIGFHLDPKRTFGETPAHQG